ncbi:hypothetical protein DFQ26_004030 [Actinomortierella ambigua]|nr:hypothetical protein DFQ26_004030 [Actinomortierella ambigua]
MANFEPFSHFSFQPSPATIDFSFFASPTHPQGSPSDTAGGGGSNSNSNGDINSRSAEHSSASSSTTTILQDPLTDEDNIHHPHHAIPVDPSSIFDLSAFPSDMPSLGLTGETDIPLQEPSTSFDAQSALQLQTPRKRERGERSVWTPEEDNYLRMAVQLYGDKTEKWAKIAACVPGRTNKNCRKRWFHSLDPSLRKGAWTEEEDYLLITGVQKFKGQWSKIAERIQGRTDDQCAKRWRESLDPHIDRAAWTAEEDALLLQKYEEFGSQWQKIAALFFPGRPGLHCRNRWRKIQRGLNHNKKKLEADSSRGGLDETGSKGGSSIADLAQLDNLNLEDAGMANSFDDIYGGKEGGSMGSKSEGRLLAENEKPYGCAVPDCNFESASPSLLFYHLKASHPGTTIDKPFRCTLPGCENRKRYKNINGLQYHITHSKNSSGHGHGHGHGGQTDEISASLKPVRPPSTTGGTGTNSNSNTNTIANPSTNSSNSSNSHSSSTSSNIGVSGGSGSSSSSSISINTSSTSNSAVPANSGRPKSLVLPAANVVTSPYPTPLPQSHSNPPTPAELQRQLHHQAPNGGPPTPNMFSFTEFSQALTAQSVVTPTTSIAKPRSFGCPELGCHHTFDQIGLLNAHMVTNHGHKAMTMSSEPTFGSDTDLLSEAELHSKMDLGTINGLADGDDSGSGSCSPMETNLLPIDVSMLNLAGNFMSLETDLMSDLDAAAFAPAGSQLRQTEPVTISRASMGGSGNSDSGIGQSGSNKRQFSMLSSTPDNTLFGKSNSSANRLANRIHFGTHINVSSHDIDLPLANLSSLNQIRDALVSSSAMVSSVSSIGLTTASISVPSTMPSPTTTLNLSPATPVFHLSSSPMPLPPPPKATQTVKRFICSTCQKGYASQSGLNTHIRNEHPETRKGSMNSGFGNSDSNRRSSKANGSASSGDSSSLSEKPFKCLVPGCGKSYNNITGLKNHLLQTHGSTPSTSNVSQAPTSHTSASTALPSSSSTTLAPLPSLT